ncbi:hypothetical protein BDN70DRAFT_874739 [Pholiota conissans]|uniref:Uncharacterized protein n=1 Tax=Pholiota conissans TaxID=109636 RepID=A0A9P5Z841_9AGAR|nr:hypothetical protein BDN70DRAFT_874739 [Pholiota conissans]
MNYCKNWTNDDTLMLHACFHHSANIQQLAPEYMHSQSPLQRILRMLETAGKGLSTSGHSKITALNCDGVRTG